MRHFFTIMQINIVRVRIQVFLVNITSNQLFKMIWCNVLLLNMFVTLHAC